MKKITSKILNILGVNSAGINLDNLYSFILDVTDTKQYSSRSKTVSKKSPPKYTLPITFDNKILELIRVSKILNYPDMIKTLPFKGTTFLW